MKVTAFSDGLESAVLVRLDADLIIPVVSISVLIVLKLFAWIDRKYEKRDAADILVILKNGDAGNEDRLYATNQAFWKVKTTILKLREHGYSGAMLPEQFRKG
jgi:predicted nucleotidyltransferase